MSINPQCLLALSFLISIFDRCVYLLLPVIFLTKKKYYIFNTIKWVQSRLCVYILFIFHLVLFYVSFNSLACCKFQQSPNWNVKGCRGCMIPSKVRNYFWLLLTTKVLRLREKVINPNPFHWDCLRLKLISRLFYLRLCSTNEDI